MFDQVVCYFRMTGNLDSYLHAHACDCLGWKCFICNGEAKDQIGIEDQFMADEYVVFTDGIDGSKWVFFSTCKKLYHLKCVTCDTEQQIHAKEWPFICTFNECKGKANQAGHPFQPITLDILGLSTGSASGPASGSLFSNFITAEKWLR